MVTQRKRNFKKYFRRLKNTNKRRFYRSYRARLRVKAILKFMPKIERQRFILKIWRLSYAKRYLLKYLKNRLDSIRIKAKLYKYSRYTKRKLWRIRYRSFYKRFYLYLRASNIGKHAGYYRIVSNFYRHYGTARLFKNIVKYVRLKARLKRRRKVFRKKKKKIIMKLSRERQDKLKLLGLLLQTPVRAGKRKLSFKIFQEVLLLLKYKYKSAFVNKYLDCLEKIRPLLYYKTMFISGKKYKIPVLMPISKSYRVSLRWLVSNSRGSGNVITAIVSNINSSLKNEGVVVKNRKEYHIQSFEGKTYVRFLRFLKSGF